jgi:formylglycine-generating enzyme required for sulfatase activity
MSQYGPDPNVSSPTLDVSARVAELREQFQSAWNSGTRPSIDSYLDQGAESGLDLEFARVALLTALVKVDLERRWRGADGHADAQLSSTAEATSGESETMVAPIDPQAIPDHPSLEDYLRRYPALAPEGTLSDELIAEEYRVRSLWGDQPAADSYLTRFASQSGTLRQALSAVDAELGSWRQATLVGKTSVEPAGSGAQIVGGSAVPTSELRSGTIGRYRCERKLAEGSFGAVYLARDDELQRFVAIKVPRASRFVDEAAIGNFVREARAAAAINHPGIVTIFDVGRDTSGACFVVMEYLPGRSLEDLLKPEQLPYSRVVDLMIEVADAVHAAHKQGLVHRDLKPANILFDAEGRPHVADFGLAVDRDARRLLASEVSGTPAYMAPEQVRGEAHRFDARTDVWALGVILYEALCRKRPFSANDLNRLFHAIQNEDPVPPREHDASVPAALDRIVLKCLSKRMADRYATAAEFGQDLKSVREGADGSGAAADHAASDKIVPRGLRSFDIRDATYFVRLLPGPTDRNGLPECLRLWKDRAEETDPEKTFGVGLLYGPTGCGKTSLVRAGLWSVLSPDVVPIYIEAAPDQTEARLLKALRRRRPDLDKNLDLTETMRLIREGAPAERKICLFIDQFEQWLFGRAIDASAELAQALRHCDGQHVQCVLMVRDDFWLPVSRFMRELEVPLVEGWNSALVDLFDPSHACKVLLEFGRAFGTLPEDRAALTPEQGLFLHDAVSSLAEEGKVVAVRLALFAEMMKRRQWTASALRELGGAEGLGAAFLEETFSGPAAAAEHRLHQAAARGVLAALLPSAGSQIKGNMRSREELLVAAGYEGRGAAFEDLLRVLDGELRLITPTTLDGSAAENAAEQPVQAGATGSNSAGEPAPAAATGFYQLAHDFLVPSLREWLTRKQRQTWRGRCELRLAEQAAIWNSVPQPRNLPGWIDWISFLIATNPRQRTSAERRMLEVAGRRHPIRILATLGALVAATVGALALRSDLIEQANAQHAQDLVERIASADVANLPAAIEELAAYRTWADPELRALASRAEPRSKTRLHAGLALLPVDGSQVEYLGQRLYDSTLEEFAALKSALGEHRRELSPDLWKAMHSSDEPAARRFRAALTLAEYDPESPHWASDDALFVASQLLAANPDDQRALRRHLAPIASRLADPLEAMFADESVRESLQEAAAVALADFASRDPVRLARLLGKATPPQFGILYAAAVRPAATDPELSAALRSELSQTPAGELSPEEAIRAGRRRAGAAVAAVLVGERDGILPVFAVTGDPESRTQFVHRLKDRGVGAGAVLECLDRARDEPARFGLVLALGEFAIEEIPADARKALPDRFAGWYAGDPSAAIHAACGWLLRHWGLAEKIGEVDRTPGEFDAARTHEWFVQKVGEEFITMVVQRPGAGVVGSPEGERDRVASETRMTPAIPYTWAIADKEVTRGLFERFQAATGRALLPIQTWSPTAEYPMVAPTWYEAVAFCRWLTEQAGMGEEDQCYADPTKPGIELTKLEDGSEVPRDWPFDLSRRGFRLPLEVEWELACRAGTTTAYSFGGDPALLRHYGCYLIDRAKQTARVGGEFRPSPAGLFDMHGNVLEWCQDWMGNAVGEQLPPEQKIRRGFRGGGWDNTENRCRSSYRNGDRPLARNADVGLRVARTLIPAK